MTTTATVSLDQQAIGFEALLESIVEPDSDNVSPSFAPSNEQIDRAIASDSTTPQIVVDLWRNRSFSSIEVLLHLLDRPDGPLDVPRLYSLAARMRIGKNHLISSDVRTRLFMAACRANAPELMSSFFDAVHCTISAMHELLISNCNGQEPLSGFNRLKKLWVDRFYVCKKEDCMRFIRTLLASRDELVEEICTTMFFEYCEANHCLFFRCNPNPTSIFYTYKPKYYTNKMMDCIIYEGKYRLFQHLLTSDRWIFKDHFSWNTDIERFSNQGNILHILTCKIIYFTCKDISTLAVSDIEKHVKLCVGILSKFDTFSQYNVVEQKIDELLTLFLDSWCDEEVIVDEFMEQNVASKRWTRHTSLFVQAWDSKASAIVVDILDSMNTVEEQHDLLDSVMCRTDGGGSRMAIRLDVQQFVTKITNTLLRIYTQRRPYRCAQYLDFWTHTLEWRPFAQHCIVDLHWPIDNPVGVMRNLCDHQWLEMFECALIQSTKRKRSFATLDGSDGSEAPVD